MNYKLGEVIYGIEILDDGETDIRGELFLAQCGDYILCVDEYVGYPFDEQLEKMYEESVVNMEVPITIFKKEYTYATLEDAQKAQENLKAGVIDDN